MKINPANRPFIAVSFTGILLAGAMALFSIPETAQWFDKKGLAFANFESVANSIPATGKKKTPIRTKYVPIIKDTGLTVEVRHQIDTLRLKLNFLENFESGQDNTALTRFFSALQTAQTETVHIWYYGDSQVEGDRITGELRQLFQATYGGNGAGYLPLMDPSTYRYFELVPGTSLISLNCFTTKKPKGFGFSGKVFLPKTKDSSAQISTKLTISKHLKYDAMYLLYGNGKGGKGSAFFGDSSQLSFDLAAASKSVAAKISAQNLHGKLTLNLPAGNDYYGLMFDCKTGVQVDNCGIRGHSGDGLLNISGQMIRDEAARWNTKLVVFHFGNNMIPYLKPGQKNMDYYRRYFENIFNRYKNLLPQASFLVVGVGDMGTEVNGEEVAYPNVQEFAIAMRQAAQNTGCAYFDANAMIAKGGGILGWKKKGFAGLDGHLTPSGEKIYAKNIYTEMMREYEVYKLLNTASH